MLLIVGLGNPGAKYARHRHNIGYVLADALAIRYGLSAPRKRFQGRAQTGEIAGEPVLLLKPETYMNESGRAVRSAIHFHKLRARNAIVIHDELDLAPGKVRIKQGGGHAGHNGLRSLVSHVGKDFRRIRIGIGHPGDKHRVQRYVLSDFPAAERPLFADVVKAVCEAFPLAVAGDDAGFMTKVAMLCPPPKPPKPPKPPGTEPPGPERGGDH